MEKTMILEAETVRVEVLFEDDYSVDMNSEKAKKYQEEANQALQQVYFTDFSNIREVVELFQKLSEFGDNIYVNLPYDYLIRVLNEHGFKRRNQDPESLSEMELSGRGLIGRIIGYMQGEYCGVKGLPPTVMYETRDYLNKFVA